MRKMNKTKRGFTLVEMVLVIAIIVILAAVLVMSIGSYVERAKNAASSVGSHNSAVVEAVSIVDADSAN